jgi:hypothetical protein
MKNKLLAVLGAGLLAGPILAHAAVIVDTGTPTGTDLYRFASIQYFAGEFTIATTYSIDSLEGFISNDLGAAGNVSAGIYGDGGNSPGAPLFSASFALSRYARENWYGAFGLAWVLGPGTYWVAFVPDSNIEGVQRGGASSPLFSDFNFEGSWQSNNCCGQGWRINASLPGTPPPVPVPAALPLFVSGLAGMSFLALRHKRLAPRNRGGCRDSLQFPVSANGI